MRPLENGDLLNSKLLCLIRALDIIFSSLLADFSGNKSEYGVRDILHKKVPALYEHDDVQGE